MKSKVEDDPFDILIGFNLRRLRIQFGISLDAVGDSIGVSYQQIQKYETGKNRISARNLFLLAQAFNVQPVRLFKGIEDPLPSDPDLSLIPVLKHIELHEAQIANG